MRNSIAAVLLVLLSLFGYSVYVQYEPPAFDRLDRDGLFAAAGFRCSFEEMGLDFAVDAVSFEGENRFGTATLIGNNGTADMTAVRGSGSMSFIEVTPRRLGELADRVRPPPGRRRLRGGLLPARRGVLRIPNGEPRRGPLPRCLVSPPNQGGPRSACPTLEVRENHQRWLQGGG